MRRSRERSGRVARHRARRSAAGAHARRLLTANRRTQTELATFLRLRPELVAEVLGRGGQRAAVERVAPTRRLESTTDRELATRARTIREGRGIKQREVAALLAKQTATRASRRSATTTSESSRLRGKSRSRSCSNGWTSCTSATASWRPRRSVCRAPGAARCDSPVSGSETCGWTSTHPRAARLTLNSTGIRTADRCHYRAERL